MAYTFNQVFGTIGSKNMITLVRVESVGDLPPIADEKTIAVVSDTEVTDWILSVTAPSAPVAGMVWLREEFFSSTVITLASTEKVRLYIAGGCQYNNGSWVSVPVYAYLDATWKLTALDVIVDGVLLYGSLTACSNSANTGVSSIAYNNGFVRFGSVANSNAQTGYVGITKLVDCTGLSSFSVDAVALNGSTVTRNFRYGTDATKPPTGNSWTASATLSPNFTWTTTRKVVTVDISALSGNHYFAIPSCAATSGGLDVFNAYFC